MRKREIAVAALFVGVISAILWDPIVDPFLHRERYRGEVRTLYENLQPGMTKEQVRREMDSGKYPHLDFDRDRELWLGSAPLEFGAGNWVWRSSFGATRSPLCEFLKVTVFKNFTTLLRRRRTKCGRRAGPISQWRFCDIGRLCPKCARGEPTAANFDQRHTRCALTDVSISG